MDIVELNDTCKSLLGLFMTDTMSMEIKHVFSPEFVVHNFNRFISLKEQQMGMSYELTISYKTFVEDGSEYGCILFEHPSGIRCLSNPLFCNSRYMRTNAYMPTVFSKFRKIELETFLIKHKEYVGTNSTDFIEAYRIYLFSIGKLFKPTVKGDNIVINTYSRKIFENGKVKPFVTVGDNLLEEAKII